MDISVFSVVYKDLPLEEALDRIKAKGVNSVEVGAGGFIGKEHCNPGELLENDALLEKFKAAFADREMEIVCLSCHGNPLHPQIDLAQEYHQDIKDAIDLASVLDVEKINSWIAKGAQPSDTVRQLLNRNGITITRTVQE